MFRKHKIGLLSKRTVFPKKYGNTVLYLSKKLLRNKNTPLENGKCLCYNTGKYSKRRKNMDKKQIAGVIFAIAYVSGIVGAISLTMNAIEMFLYFPIHLIITMKFYQKIAAVLLAGAIISIIGIAFQSIAFSDKFKILSKYSCWILFFCALGCIVCIPFTSGIEFYFDSTYYAKSTDLQIHQSAVAMLLQQAVYFIILGFSKLIMDKFPKNKIPPTNVQT